MAKRERERTDRQAPRDLSDQEVEARWKALLLDLNHRAARATAVWTCLGRDYEALAYQTTT
jgi:hypothetical protein